MEQHKSKTNLQLNWKIFSLNKKIQFKSEEVRMKVLEQQKDRTYGHQSDQQVSIDLFFFYQYE